MSQPRLGEPVHYLTATGCAPAFVESLPDDTSTVNLNVLTPGSVDHHPEVRHDETKRPNTWHWACDTRRG